MAEVAALGAAASILQLVEFTTTAIGRLVEYRNMVDSAPTALKQVLVELPVLKFTLQQLQHTFSHTDEEHEADAVFGPLSKECEAELRSLDLALAEVLPNAANTTSQKLTKAFKSLKYDTYIDGPVQKVCDYVRDLVFASLSFDPFKDSDLPKVRKWIHGFAPPDPSPFHQKALKKRHPDTGRWFLDGEEYAT
ncbi:hypothetical protein K458DRAFT_418798 [Lentithecium fluviatile CBS 122367]|uniref:NACHT-NTPase and P-loop NTPases N-terminal domain-containing protein n=1 Tax=Lentithecium fluviatile CBS 122367 TaxID=1168545 RepID=A0A6G1J0U4_9PLEO|nr:hypothetical protein K458DRAFT_418798 [Lentithecium fluviatile CBS 122367]